MSHPRPELAELEDHIAFPRGRGALADARHSATAGGAACGDLIRVAVRIEGERVAEAGFDASGCGSAVAAGSAVVELAGGAPLLDAARITPAAVSEVLGGLSIAKLHAAELAADALHRALGAAAKAGAARLSPLPHRTLVAMSGGVDSAMAAQLALDAGEEVIAVTLELWADPDGDGTKSCCSPQAVSGARALAHRMGLAHLTLDLRSDFRAGVVDDFLAGYAEGRTPNPCVRCNGLVRFDAMLALAEQLGAARLATGHYARIADDGGGPLLRSAADPQKDQSYMLVRLEPRLLERLAFPLGELDKSRVRELARAAQLPVAEKAESQDLCFVAGLGAKAFLRRHGGLRAGPPARAEGAQELQPEGAPEPLAASTTTSPQDPDALASDGLRDAGPRGEIVSESGEVLGTHGGQQEFTVGQRRGIGVAAAEPLYVLRKDAATNRVTVGPRRALATRAVAIAPASLHRPGAQVDRVKLRYRSAPVPCRVEGKPPAGCHRRLELALERPAEGVAPGQTACLLAGDHVVGWGTIVDA